MSGADELSLSAVSPELLSDVSPAVLRTARISVRPTSAGVSLMVNFRVLPPCRPQISDPSALMKRILADQEKYFVNENSRATITGARVSVVWKRPGGIAGLRLPTPSTRTPVTATCCAQWRFRTISGRHGE